MSPATGGWSAGLALVGAASSVVRTTATTGPHLPVDTTSAGGRIAALATLAGLVLVALVVLFLRRRRRH